MIAANKTSTATALMEEKPGWKVGVHVAPGYASHTANHSPVYASNMNYSSEKAQANVGGGFSVQYKTASRWSVETGMYYARSGSNPGSSFNFMASKAEFDQSARSTDQYYNMGVTMNRGQLAMNSMAGVIEFSRTPSNAEMITTPESLSGLTTAMLTPGEFAQVFDFVELPLFARYALVESAIGVEISGGITTGIIIGNNVYMDSNPGRELVGKTQDISTINFAGNAGVGLIYSMGKNISLSVEPRLSYYLSSINHSNAVSFKPWRVGVFTGLSYEF
jgi:hypothetical protein